MYQASPRLLHEGLLRSARRVPGKTCVVVDGASYTFAELENQSACLASALYAQGVKRGDRVAIFMDNTWCCVVSLFAVLRAGAAFMVVNAQTKADKLRYMLEDSGTRVLLTDIQLQAPLRELLADPPSPLRHLLVAGEGTLDLAPANGIDCQAFGEALASRPPLPPRQDLIPNDLAALIYTSGSTGNPKGVMHTHQSLVFLITTVMDYLRLGEHDRILNVLPLAFGYGLHQAFIMAWLGATLVLERSFMYPQQVLNRIEEQQATVFPAVPTIYSMLIAAYQRKPFSLPSITRITNAAAALPGSMLPTLRQIFPNALIFKMYGQTECQRGSYLPPELIDSHGDSVGKAIPGTEVFLCSPDGERLPPGSEGILHIRGPHLMAGYWNRPEQTAHMLIPGELPGERILCTHDWFRMDEEGFLYFLGRDDDIIKSRGEKVSPYEVEKVLLALDGVDEAVVFGVPDEILGQAVKAVVTLRDASALNETLIRRHCAARLENFMVPKHVEIIAQMPKLPNGKVDRKVLKAFKPD